MKKQQPKRPQINLVADQSLLEAIERIRLMTSPIPTISDAVRGAIFDKCEALTRKTERERRL